MNIKGKKGVDISSLNGSVNMETIKKAGYDFVMIRCGYGSDIKSQDDTQFENNVRKAEAAGMPWGVYLYSYALSEKDAKSEAEHVKRLLKGKKPTLPVAFDMEDGDGYKAKHGGLTYQNINTACKVFIEEIRKAGYYPMLYTGLYYLRDYISKEVTDSVDIWLAQWNSVPQYTGDNLGMWQYGGETNFIESNSIPGVGVIDKDKAYKDYPTIIKEGGYNGWKPDGKVLDKTGYTKGDRGDGVMALKELLIVAKKLKIITQGVDENSIFGEGTHKAVNQILKLGGYAQNGIAGEKWMKYAGNLIKESL